MSIYAVNGKEPIAAWIESLDPEAVTSSKATDLIGTNHGTLTNMDLTADPDTARRADAGAGGSRALQFDGSNDYVTGMGSQNLANPLSWSVWVKPIAGQFNQIGGQGNGAGSGLYLTIGDTGGVFWYPVFASPVGSTTAGAWNHICGCFDGTTAKLFVNGTEVASTSSWGRTDSASHLEFGRVIFNTPFYGGVGMRIDDFRRFGQALTEADIAYLATSRGIVASTGKKRPRINGSLINSGLCGSRT